MQVLNPGFDLSLPHFSPQECWFHRDIYEKGTRSPCRWPGPSMAGMVARARSSRSISAMTQGHNHSQDASAGARVQGWHWEMCFQQVASRFGSLVASSTQAAQLLGRESPLYHLLPQKNSFHGGGALPVLSLGP